MPGSRVKLAQVIIRLDFLDGKDDDHYNRIPLLNHSATAICEIAEELDDQLSLELAKKESAPAKKSEEERRVQAPLEVGDGRTVVVDCKELVKKLNVLAGIAERLPVTKYFADVSKKVGSASQLRQFTYEDFYGYHIVDFMISTLLEGKSVPGVPFHKLFSGTPFLLCDVAANDYIDIIHQKKTKGVTTINGAFTLFQMLGEKYTFDTRPFAPPKSSKSTRP